MPRVLDKPRSDCPITNSLDILGDRWTLVVLRDLLLAHKRTFGELGVPEKIPTNTLTDRLTRLEEGGIIERRRDPNDGRRRSYVPTDKGIDLIPILIDLLVWGIEHDLGTAHAEVAVAARKNRKKVIADATKAARAAR